MRARSDDGAFESDERVRVAGPVVEFSEHGARVLADRYRLEVERGFNGRTLLPELAGEHDVVAVSRSGAEVQDDRVKPGSQVVSDDVPVRVVRQ